MTIRSILVTGASGFVGQQLLQQFTPGEFELSVAGRNRPAIFERLLARWYPLDLPDQLPADEAFEGVDAIVHLAAATGKVRPELHYAINLAGTQELLARAARFGISRFLFVSSIAAAFTEIRRYPYARSKLAAEQAVSQAGLAFTILRPTIIAGEGGGAWQGIWKLARLPVTPVFGNGRTIVQPIDVRDLAALIAVILRTDHFLRETIEAGGPERVAIGDLIRTIRLAQQRNPSRTIRLPLGLTNWMIGRFEDAFGPILPITAGQLCTFREDGTARPHQLPDSMRSRMIDLDAMIARSLNRCGD